MTSPPELIVVKCPACGAYYQGSYRASLNFSLEDFDAEYLDRITSSTCPHCGYKVSHDVLIVREDGTWVLDGKDGKDA